jgi:N-methylhydantoinase A
MAMGLRIGIDTGGTFTDLVAIEETKGNIVTAKKPSTPKDPIVGILDTLEGSDIDRELLASSQLIHGTTVLTNCLIERKGAKINLLITEGFEDVPYIQRINRKGHYDLQWDKPSPLVRRRDTYGVAERLDYNGDVVVSLTGTEIDRIIRILRKEIKKGETLDGDGNRQNHPHSQKGDQKGRDRRHSHLLIILLCEPLARRGHSK